MEFICKVCAKTFKFQSGLSRHGRIHKGLRVECACGRSFSRQDSLSRHQLMSSACRTLEQEHVSDALKSNNPTTNKDTELSQFNNKDSSSTSIDAFTQTEKYEDSVSDNSMTDVEDPTDSSETGEECKKRKVIKAQPSSEYDDSDTSVTVIKKAKINGKYNVNKAQLSSEDDDSDSSVPVSKSTKKKHRLHRLRKVRKLKNLSLPIPSKPYVNEPYNQYGVNSIDRYGSGIVRKMGMLNNLARFKPRDHNPLNGVGLLGQLLGGM